MLRGHVDRGPSGGERADRLLRGPDDDRLAVRRPPLDPPRVVSRAPEAEPAVVGRVVVPTRSSWLLVSYQYDESEETAFGPGLGEVLASLRILERARGMDGLTGLQIFLLAGVAAWLAYAGVRLLLA